MSIKRLRKQVFPPIVPFQGKPVLKGRPRSFSRQPLSWKADFARIGRNTREIPGQRPATPDLPAGQSKRNHWHSMGNPGSPSAEFAPFPAAPRAPAARTRGIGKAYAL